MKFSILVPVYNVEKYLSQCIESVIHQTEQDFELILVDDGSKDRSGKICDDYQKQFENKIKVIHQDNKGLLLTRRVSIKEAKGEYCIFLDADDFLREDALEIIKRLIVENDADLAIYNCYYITDDGLLTKRDPVFNDQTIFKENDKKALYKVLLENDALNNLVLKAVKRELIDSDVDYSGMYFVSNAEDLLQTLPIVTNAKKIIYTSDALYYYRQNQSSMTKNFSLVWFDSVEHVFNQLKSYAKIWSVSGEKDKMLLRHRFLVIVIEAIRQLSLSSCMLDSIKRKEYITKLAANENFIDAYDNAKHDQYGLYWSAVLSLLRKGDIKAVKYITDTKRSIERMKHKVLSVNKIKSFNIIRHKRY